ncbi:unnamed protein product [Commensalibacter communis]|uniref:DUF7079 domain-containing protein n=1 Tax=Commensalibacter communis TaxID=2972786 RepID=A0A9W4TR20_9PROT|nr:hypothetical protein [Commensalibacter communis]CAI3939630.1 unnamed protein product [Commensalibacter communis]CAI3940732.1 unnamed protein product [Commensalibacter communis]CAI3943881.1 unnamed protein product [Commensalibacter communis]CAI3945918.1 unnamed protein product [Commensalibacter communis]
MDKPLTYIDLKKDLYKVLLGFFLNREINYSYIVSVAQNTPTTCVERMLFEEVAPVYYLYFRNMLSSAWVDWDKEILWKNIREYQEKYNEKFSFYKMRHKYLVFYFRKKYQSQWIELKKQLEALKYYRKAKNMEGMVLTDIDLCEALSDMFIDSETNFIYIAPVANRFPIEHVKKVYFEWVAPVCYPNLCSPIPSIWMGFDRDELWKDIQEYKAKNSNLDSFGKKMHKLSLFHLRNTHIVKYQWKELEKYMNTYKNNNA